MKRKNNPIIPHDKLRLHSAERNDMWENNILSRLLIHYEILMLGIIQMLRRLDHN